MELYGSLSNISGSVTASAFTGSFIGDGSGLSGIQASGVTGLNLSQISIGSISASLSPNGFNVNTDTSITGSLKVSGNITAEQYNVTLISSSVLFQSGSSKLGDTLDDTHQFTGSVNITGSISLNGEPIGTGKLNETTFQAYTSSNDGRVSALETSSGSLNSFTSSINTTIKSKLDSDNVISGSVQVNITGTTGFSTFSSSISSSIGDISSSIATTTNNLSTSIASTDLSQTNRLISIESKTGSYATTGSNIFIGTQTHSGSILPSVDNAYDLGSVTHQWRDVYISSGSLYIDGTKVLSSTAQELTITTDTGQSIKILEGTTDSIILQTADGDIELKSSADGDILLDPTNGKIMLKGTIEVFNGNKIQSSVGGTPVVFANDIGVSGSIELTGTVDGIDLTAFSSSLNGRLGSLESSGGSLNSFTASAIGRLNALETTTSSLNTYTSSNNTRLGVIEGTTSSINTFTSSASSRLSSIETTTGSLLSVNTTQNGRLDSLETTSGSILTANTTQNGRLDSIEGKTGSYATTGSNIFQGNQIITGSLFVSQNLIIAGSSSIQNISSSVLNIADNIITVNAVNPSVRFGGLEVIDSGSSPQLSGSILFDSVNDQWIFVHQNQGTVTSSVVLMGPETFNNLGNEGYITANRLPKGSGIEHLRDSNISDNGTTVTILSNAVVNGTFSATGTTLVSGSSQISHDSTTGYVANRHIDHTSVSITAGSGLSGGGDISSTRTLTLDTGSVHFLDGVKKELNTEGVVSGSSQISYTGLVNIPGGIVSGSSQISYPSLSNIPLGIVSGSSQVSYTGLNNIPGGIVSGSIQIDLTATTNYSSGIKTRLNAEGVISGSSQVTGIGNSQLTNSSFFVGTTSISLGRASASQTLTGISIDGNATSETLSTVTSRGASTSTAITISTSTDQMITLNATDSSWAYVGLSWNGTRRSYIGLNGSGEPEWGTDNGNAFRFVGSSTMTVGGNTVWHAGNLTNLSQLTNGPGYITGITFTNVSSKPTTLSGYGITDALSNDSDSEQDVGGRHFRFNHGTNRINIDPRWNESGYDANMGVFHMYSTTAAGAQWGRTGLALYNGSAYQYLTTKDGQNHLYINNNIAIHAGNFNSYALPLGGGTMTGIITTVSNGTAINFSGQSDSFGYNNTSGLGTYIKGTGSTYIYGGGSFFDGSTQRVILHAGNFTSYAMSGAGFSANQNLNTNSNVSFNSVTGAITSSGNGDGNAPFRFGADYSGWMSIVAGAPGSNNGWGLFWAGNSGAQYGTNGASGPGDIWGNSGNPNEYVFVGNGLTAMSVYGNTGDVWIRGNARVESNIGIGVNPALKFHVRGSGEMIRFENTSTGSNEYTQLNFRAGSRNGYIWLGNQNTSSWAGAGGLNIYTDSGHMDFWTNNSQRVRIGSDGHMVPFTNNAFDLGSPSLGWRNVYTNDLHLSNMNKPEGNDVDGTNGNWTIQEGAENLYIINNNNGKKFKISLEEII